MTLSDEQIVSFLSSQEKESKAIKEEVLRQCWFMRGAISYSEAMMMGDQERLLINKITSENIEISKKSGMPFF